LNIVFGGNAFGDVEFPFRAVEFMGRPIVTIEKDNRDGLLFTFDVLDREGKILARVVKNVVTSYTRAYVRPRKTLHSIIIEDEQGKVALSIDYVNAHAVVIEANMYIPPYYLLAILPTQIDVGFLLPGGDRMSRGMTLRGSAFCEAGHTGLSFKAPASAEGCPANAPHCPRGD
jgi:hypothetical protein